MSTALKDRIEDLVEEFQFFDNWEDRYRHLICLGRELPDYPEEHRNEDHKVKGCVSQVWLHSSQDGDKVSFIADSDAAIVKGLVAILLRIYSDTTPQAILETPPTFLDQMDLKNHLSMNRSNGLASMLEQIRAYAMAYQIKNQG